MNNLQERYYEREYDEVPSSLLINYASRTLEQFTPTPFSPKPYTSSSSVISLHDFTRFGHTSKLCVCMCMKDTYTWSVHEICII